MIPEHLSIVSPRLYSNRIFAKCRIIVAASTVEKERSKRLSTSILNQVVQESKYLPNNLQGPEVAREVVFITALSVYYCTQVIQYIYIYIHIGGSLCTMGVLMHYHSF